MREGIMERTIVRLIIIGIFSLLSLGVSAQDVDPLLSDARHDLGGHALASATSPLVGNPIHAGTGNKYQTETDYRVSSTPLAFVRYYNSYDARVGVLGSNWRHNYERAITLSTVTTTNDTATVTRADGKAYTFTDNAGVWTTDADVTATLSGNATSGFVYTMQNGTVENYDASGRLVSIVNRNSQTVTLSYNATSGKLETVTGPFNRTLTFTYDANGNIATLTDPDAGVYQYGYDATHNNLTGVEYPDTTTRGYLYEKTTHPHHLTGITDENNQRYATYDYDAEGRGTLSEHAGGVDRFSLVYNSDGTTTVTDPSNRARIYHFETHHGVIKVARVENGTCTSCGGTTQNATYDANGFVQSKTDFNGNVTNHINNARGLPESRTEAVGTPEERTITTVWHPTYAVPTKISEVGRDTDFTHYADGSVKTKTVTDTVTQAKRSWAYTYNTQGQPLSVDGPRTDVVDNTTYAYDATSGSLITVTNALNQVTQITSHDNSGRPLTLVDPNGLITTLTYTPRGQIESRKVGNETTGFTYDNAGNLKRITLPDASYLEYTYDAAQRVEVVTDHLGNSINYTLTAAGSIESEQVNDPAAVLVRSISRTYNDLNQLESVTGNNLQSTTYGYDGNGNPTSSEDADLNKTVYAFDALNRVTGMTDAKTSVADYGYDALDNLRTVTDLNANVTTYNYDGLGNLISQTSPDTGTTSFTHDDAGNVLSQTDAKNQTTSYEYDALNRVTLITYADSSTVALTYDTGTNAIGRLSSITDSSDSTAYGYDAYGRISSKTQTIGNVSLTHGYAYNAAGQLESHTYPSGLVVGYSYTSGQISGLTLNGQTPLLSNIQWQAFGPATQWNWGNGQVKNFSYDLDGRLDGQSLAGEARSYSFDKRDNITGITDLAGSQTFSYDEINRLLTGTRLTVFDETFDYDANSNRISLTDAVSLLNDSYAIEASSNKLNGISGTNAFTYTYEANGSISSKLDAGGLGQVYAYNAQNRLSAVTVKTPGKGSKIVTTITDYGYNALGQRVSKTTESINTLFGYGEAGELIGIYDTSGVAQEEIIYFQGAPVATVRNGDIFYVHTDHLGTPRRVTDADNSIVWSWDSNPFGTSEPVGVKIGKGKTAYNFAFNLRFPGQYYDSESGLHYNYFRYYDPSTGRYITSDPIGLQGGLNTYGYVGGNPVKYSDPLGLYIWEGVVTAKAASAGGGAIKYTFSFTSPCVNGERYTVTGFAGGFILGAGLQFAASWDKVEANDSIHSGPLDPKRFSGYSEFWGANARAHRGPGASGGHFGKVYWSSAQWWGGEDSDGIDASIFFGNGNSWIQDIKKEKCGCEIE